MEILHYPASTKTNAGTWFPRFSDDLRFNYQIKLPVHFTRGLMMHTSGCVSAGIYSNNPILRTLLIYRVITWWVNNDSIIDR